MTREKYLAMRTQLTNEAQALINENKLEDAENKMKEMEELDNDYEASAKAQANLNALNKGNSIVNISGQGNNAIGTTIDNTNTKSNGVYGSLEYRQAFMDHILKGQNIPKEFKNETTGTADVGAVIPETVLEKIVEKLEATGMILPLVTRTAIKGGVSVPISSVKPVATWVGEGASSPKQKKPANGTITFAYHKLRCAVAVSLEVDNMSLPVFESTLINNVVEAMTKALEQAIVSGTGIGQPKGILTETPISGQSIDITSIDYNTLIEAEGALPLEYEANAVWCMTKKTFMSFTGITDSTGQPIARVNYGIGGKPERTLLGRSVVLCNYLDSYAASLTAGKAFAFIFNFSDYILNTNYNMGIKKYEDNDTDDMITKAVMLADGKVVDKSSLVVLKKKASA